METFDLAIIGAGPGGYPAAIRAAQLGARVALLEREALGGCCLNWGCIPSKSLLAVSRLYTQIQAANKMGIRIEAASVDYSESVRRKDRTVEQLRKGIRQLLRANKVTLIEGSATYRDRRQILVRPPDDKGSFSIQADRSIIATGMSLVSDSFPRHSRILDSRSFFELKELPSSIMIWGAHVIGCELACLLGQLGVRVLLLERGECVIEFVDEDVRRELLRSLTKTLGVRLLTGAEIQEIRTADDKLTVIVDGQEYETDYLIDTKNFKPATAGLGLERARVELDRDGFVRVDEFLETSAAGIYAIGDVTGHPLLAHRATSQGLLAAGNALKRPQKDEGFVPCCVYTDPEIAKVGIGEEEATRLGVETKVGKFRMAALGRALTLDSAYGFVKWIADAETDQLLGAQAVGPQATELIAEATVALREELTATELARTVHAHPTLSEAWAEAGQEILGLPIHAVPTRGGKK